jgi:NAD kinase
VPVLGVDYGNVGFLVEIEPSELADALGSLTSGEFSLEPHHAIEVTAPRPASRAPSSPSTSPPSPRRRPSTDRSVVLGPNERLRFTIGEGTRSAALELDGRVVSDIGEGSVVTVRLRKDAGSVVRLDAGRHGRKRRLKLSLMDLPLRNDQLLELVPVEVRARFALLR